MGESGDVFSCEDEHFPSSSGTVVAFFFSFFPIYNSSQGTAVRGQLTGDSCEVLDGSFFFFSLILFPKGP